MTAPNIQPLPAAPPDRSPLLSVCGLTVSYRADDGWLEALQGVHLDVPRQHSVVVVGESGSGKSTLALAIMGLLPPRRTQVQGQRLQFESSNLLSGPDAWNGLRGRRMAMIFQEPASALNPVLTVEDQIQEVLQLHRGLARRAARREALDLLNAVGITAPETRLGQYPHQLSGGMCQRVMIAMALAGRPDLLIADEPTTALDVTVQTQILALLRSLQRRRGLGLLLITHDIRVASQVADTLVVMYAGRVVECGPAAEVLSRPMHPYTVALLACRPQQHPRGSQLPTIPGQVPDLRSMPPGCRFHPRCALAVQRGTQRAPDLTLEMSTAGGPLRIPRSCAEDPPPPLRRAASAADAHRVACLECPSPAQTSLQHETTPANELVRSPQRETTS